MQPISINLDLEQIEKTKLRDNHYIEYIYHKLFDNPDHSFDKVDPSKATWNYPLCWLSRYYLYYQLHKDILKNANILDIGSNLNFYSAWAMLNGARHVYGIEADPGRHALGREYVQLRGLENNITTENISIDEFIKTYDNTRQYDVVFFLDVFYYLNNGIHVLKFIKDIIKPKFLFFESTIVDDLTDDGHFAIWYPSMDPKKFQSYQNSPLKTALMPSRKALLNVVQSQGWQIRSYYDYHDLIGHGESPPRREGKKDFYLLEI